MLLHWIRVALVTCCCLGMPLAWASLAPIFGKIELVRDASLSPDGQQVAAVIISGGKPMVVTAPFGSSELTPVVTLKSPADRITDVTWVSNNRLFINAMNNKKMSANYYSVHKAYLVNSDGSELVELVDRAREREKDRFESAFSTTFLVNRLLSDPDHIIVSSLDPRDNNNALFKVNIHKASFEKYESGASNRSNFVLDRSGNVLFSQVVERAKKQMHIDIKQADGWKPIWTIDLEGDDFLNPLSATEDPNVLLVTTNIGSEFTYIAKFDIAQGKITEHLYADPQHDVTPRAVIDGELAGYNIDGDFLQVSYLHPQLKNYQQQLDKLLKDRHNYIVSYSQDLSRILFYSTSDRSPPRYYTVDFSKGQVQLFFSLYPQLEQQTLHPVEKFAFKARDGKNIEGYLTLPKSSEAAPVILFPHGGPHSRDHMAFDPWVQFMAELGYAVVQVNFRGSEGYGKSFEVAGYRQWGKAMQDDLMDAMKHLQANSRLDTSRSCVVGASYGGYAALVASFRDSKAFQCFISIAGISDMVGLLTNEGRYSPLRDAINAVTVGDRKTETKALDDVSAIHHLEQINKPLLLIHGVKDVRVNVEQSRALFNLLKKRNANVQYLELEDGTHFFDEEQDRIKSFERMETFLQQHLPVKM